MDKKTYIYTVKYNQFAKKKKYYFDKCMQGNRE